MEKKSAFARNPKLFGFGFLALFYLILDFLAGAVVIPNQVKTYTKFRTSHPVYHHDLLPSQSSTDVWGDKVYAEYTNNLGLRDARVRNIELKKVKRRILLIGDSFTEGVSLKYEETFAGKIDAFAQTQNIEVLNAGVVSYSPKIYNLKTRHLLGTVGLEIDELICFIDISDIQDEVIYDTYFDLKPIVGQKLGLLQAIKQYIRNHSLSYYIVSLVYHKIKGEQIIEKVQPSYFGKSKEQLLQERESWTSDTALAQAWVQQGLQLAKTNMSALALYCKQKGVKLTLVAYPWPYQLKNSTGVSIQERTWQLFCDSNKLDFINLFPVFKQDAATDVVKKYYIDGDSHWNKAGNDLVFEAIKKSYFQ